MNINSWSFNLWNLKSLKNKFILVYLAKFRILKQTSFFFFKKLSIFCLLSYINYNIFYYKSFTKSIYNFLKGLVIKINIEGKRVRLFINSFFLFFQMDTSHFNFLKFKSNFFLKKLKKKKILFFYSFNFKILKKEILNFQKFKKPTRFKKKGIFFSNINC